MINITVEFDHTGSDDSSARAYERTVAEWIQRIIAVNCAFKTPDIHIDIADHPWLASSPPASKSPDGVPSS